MFQISADLTSLTQAQREAIAGFILTFPTYDGEVVEEPIVTMAEPVATYVEPEETLDFSAPLPAGVLAFPSQVDPPFPHPAASMIDNNAVVANGSNLDISGLPWDERIHAGSKARNADGSWRYKRGVESRLVDQVQAELKALMGLPAPVIAPQVITLNGVFGKMSDNGPLPVPFPPPAVPAAAAVPSITASPVVSAPTVAAPNPFVSLITFAGAKNMEGKLTDAEIQAACVAVGVPAIPLMTNRHDLCPYVEQSLRLLCSTR